VPAETVDRLVRSGYAEAEPGGVRLTAAGDAEAARLTRVHRLWETYLAGEGVPLEAVHGDAHLMEHLLDREAAEALDEAIGYPALDPHGDPIPRPGRPASAAGVPLTGWPAGQPARITHLEDEPEEGLATLVRLGLAPGAVVTPLGRDDGRLRVRLGERELLVPVDAAEQVQVVGLAGGEIS
jgi:Mn-dependent DtxR family transcriptional regulator